MSFLCAITVTHQGVKKRPAGEILRLKSLRYSIGKEIGRRLYGVEEIVKKHVLRNADRYCHKIPVHAAEEDAPPQQKYKFGAMEEDVEALKLFVAAGIMDLFDIQRERAVRVIVEKVVDIDQESAKKTEHSVGYGPEDVEPYPADNAGDNYMMPYIHVILPSPRTL